MIEHMCTLLTLVKCPQGFILSTCSAAPGIMGPDVQDVTHLNFGMSLLLTVLFIAEISLLPRPPLSRKERSSSLRVADSNSAR